jgi:serine/threonine protein kinase/tetratricopeptide (TPR) repeat protein
MLRPPNIANPLTYGAPSDPIASLRAALNGHYELEREIGQGAFATVYLARDLKHERKVAIKVLNADPTSEMGELRFIREIGVLARLQHPNILPLHDSGHVEALLYYVMPYVSGETLRDRIHRERQLPIQDACTTAREIADALSYAHGQGIIHRDIKPENILLSATHAVVADFGIARAIDLAGVRQLTRTGMHSPGTPAYMSPEQLLNEREIDARSDIYSLGCVFYEMLTGRPPFSGKEGFVKRFTEPAPLASTVRTDVPPSIDQVLAIALAKNPNDRYQTASELTTELSVPSSGAPAVTIKHKDQNTAASPNSAGRLHPKPRLPDSRAAQAKWLGRFWHQRKFMVLAASGLVAVALTLGKERIVPLRSALLGASVDSTRIALVPFAGSAPRRERDRISNAIYATLSEWRDLHLASDQDVAEATRDNGPPTSTRAAAALAKQLGAGKFVWGQVNGDDPPEGYVQLFDVSSSVALKSIRVPATGDGAGIVRLAYELLKTPDRPAPADGGDGRTASYAAWTSYGQGHVALWNGDFAAAEKHFREAVSADRDFGPARLWLAQILSWRSPGSRGEWREQIAQALGARSGLSQRDHLVAIALSKLADGVYADACASYSELTRTDSLDFIGQYGLGQCQAFDSVVIRSAASPSGWRFRSRYSDAASAYMRALTINPAAHAILPFDQLEQLLPIAPLKTRRGESVDGQKFAAFPSLLADTVVFVPYPLLEFDRLRANHTAAPRDAAIEQDRTRLLDFATDWARQSPNNAAAFQALAEVLEARAEISRSVSGGFSALDAVRKARQVAVSPRERELAATEEAWLRFKQGNFLQARLLADSILAGAYSFPDDAAEIIGLAALTGKLERTAELARRTNDYTAAAASLPVQVMDGAAPFFAFAALGVCSDTTRALERTLDDQLAHYVAEDRLPEVRVAVKARPLSMLVPCTDGQSSLEINAAGNWLLKLQQAFALRDRQGFGILLRSVASDAKTQRPGDVSLDVTYQLAWLRAATGDTAAAVRQLDRALGALPSLSASSLREAGSAAAAGRAIALRVELASAQGDREGERKWARALADLWATADPPLQSVVTKMRGLAAQSLQK